MSVCVATSSGSGIPAHEAAAGTTSTVHVDTFGNVRVVDEVLNAVGAGYLQQGLPYGTDQSTGLLDFLTALTSVSGGAVGYIPRGEYFISEPVTAPVANGPIRLLGDWPGGGASNAGGTVITLTGDIADPAPFTAPQPALDLRQIGACFIKGFMLQGIYAYNPGPGGFPCGVAGLGVATGSHVEDYSCAAFSSGLVYGGLVSGNSTQYGYDHSSLHNLNLSGVGFGILLASHAGGAGDQTWERVEINANIASVAIGQSASSGFVGSTIKRSGWYSPIGVYCYEDVATEGSAQFSTNTLIGVSGEDIATAWFYDEYGAVFADNDITQGGFYKTPNNGLYGYNWAKTFNVVSVSGNQITLTDGSGWLFRPGMQVTGTNIPANTLVTAVAGSWPWSTVTLTLSNAPTGTPSTVTVAIPLMGAFASHYSIIRGNRFGGSIMNGATGYPFIVAGSSYNNRIDDFYGAVGLASQSPLLGAGEPQYAEGGAVSGYGLTAGIPRIGQLLSGCLQENAQCEVGDLLMSAGIGYGNCPSWAQCDGTRRPIGAALQAVSANARSGVDVLASGVYQSQGVLSPTVNNKTSSSIAAGSLVYVDSAHPGGVTATQPSSGWTQPVGVVSTSAIAAGSSGVLDELWC